MTMRTQVQTGRCGGRLAGMVPVRVVATMAHGAVQSGGWGVALDGLLASELRAAAKAQGDSVEPLDVPDPTDWDLPLARCSHAVGSVGWHWMATCAQPQGVAEVDIDVREIFSRVDERHLEQVTTTLPKVVSARQGRFRARARPVVVQPCRFLQWNAVGDPEQIRNILQHVWSIGAKRGQGDGQVSAWSVQPIDGDPWEAGHLHADGSLGRPTPAACLQGREVVDGGRGTAGLRPPYMHVSRQHTLHLPAQEVA